jgi:hypothetical protein
MAARQGEGTVNRRQLIGRVAVIGVVLLAQAAPRTEAIAEQERAALVQYLTTTRDQVLSEAATLSDEQWSFKAAPDRWSVGDVVEHLALAEAMLFGLQQKTVASPAATPEQKAATAGKDEMLRKAIPDRTNKAKAPEPLQPGKGSLGARSDILAAFKERRAKTLEYASTTKDELRAHIAESPLGPLDAYQWLLFVAAHTERHLGQIREVKADAGFPKSGTN